MKQKISYLHDLRLKLASENSLTKVAVTSFPQPSYNQIAHWAEPLIRGGSSPGGFIFQHGVHSVPNAQSFMKYPIPMSPVEAASRGLLQERWLTDNGAANIAKGVKLPKASEITRAGDIIHLRGGSLIPTFNTYGQKWAPKSLLKGNFGGGISDLFATFLRKDPGFKEDMFARWTKRAPPGFLSGPGSVGVIGSPSSVLGKVDLDNLPYIKPGSEAVIRPGNIRDYLNKAPRNDRLAKELIEYGKTAPKGKGLNDMVLLPRLRGRSYFDPRLVKKLYTTQGVKMLGQSGMTAQGLDKALAQFYRRGAIPASPKFWAILKQILRRGR